MRTSNRVLRAFSPKEAVDSGSNSYIPRLIGGEEALFERNRKIPGQDRIALLITTIDLFDIDTTGDFKEGL
jgi:hypothetical protein